MYITFYNLFTKPSKFPLCHATMVEYVKCILLFIICSLTKALVQPSFFSWTPAQAHPSSVVGGPVQIIFFLRRCRGQSCIFVQSSNFYFLSTPVNITQKKKINKNKLDSRLGIQPIQQRITSTDFGQAGFKTTIDYSGSSSRPKGHGPISISAQIKKKNWPPSFDDLQVYIPKHLTIEPQLRL